MFINLKITAPKTPELNTIAIHSWNCIGMTIKTIALQVLKQGVQLNGLKFRPNDWYKLVIVKNTAKETAAIIVIIYLFGKFHP